MLAKADEDWAVMCQMVALRAGYEIAPSDLRPALRPALQLGKPPLQQHCQLGLDWRFQCWLGAGPSIDPNWPPDWPVDRHY